MQDSATSRIRHLGVVDVIIIVSCRIWELLTDNERWRAVLEVMLRKAAHALAVVRGVRDPSAEGNR
jgi:hypothetical protein